MAASGGVPTRMHGLVRLELRERPDPLDKKVKGTAHLYGLSGVAFRSKSVEVTTSLLDVIHGLQSSQRKFTVKGLDGNAMGVVAVHEFELRFKGVDETLSVQDVIGLKPTQKMSPAPGAPDSREVVEKQEGPEAFA